MLISLIFFTRQDLPRESLSPQPIQGIGGKSMPGPTRSTLSILLLLFSYAATLRAEGIFPVERFQLHENLDASSAMLLHDTEDAATVMALPADDWKPVFKDDRLTDGRRGIWMKTKLQNRLQVPVRVTLLMKTSLFQSVRFFVIDEQILTEQTHYSGTAISLLHTFGDVQPAHTLNLAPGKEREVLVNLRGDAPHDFSWEIQDTESYQRQAIRATLRANFLQIMLLLVVLIALAQGFAQKRSIPLALALFVGLAFLFMARMTHSPLLSLFWEPFSHLLPPLNPILCGVQASLLLLLRRLSYGIEPKARIQKFYWLGLGFYVLYLSFIVLLHEDQSLLFMLPAQILLFILLLGLERLAGAQAHPRHRMMRVLLLQQALLLGINLMILSDLFPIWHLPEVSHWIYVISSCTLVFMGLPSHRTAAAVISMPVAAIKDPTQMPQAESKSNLLHEQWLHAEKMAALGTFTNGLANELNNPLAIIAGHRFRLSSMIESRSFNIHEFEKSLGKVDQAVNRMIAVIDALKVYSQDPQGEEVFKAFSARETIKYTIDLCRDKVVSRGIKFATPELSDGSMEGHQGQIIQVLLILVDNAIDALEASSDKTIRIELQTMPDTLRMAVMDSGPGVPLGLRGRVWDPFFTTKDPFRHKGLGLSIASGIISNHRGRIFLDESTPETRFVIELPRTRRPLNTLPNTTPD